MTWDVIQTGGPWTIALGVAWLVWRGHLVLGRELTKLSDDNKMLRSQLDSVTSNLAANQAAERESLQAQIQELREENAALRRGESS